MFLRLDGYSIKTEDMLYNYRLIFYILRAM